MPLLDGFHESVIDVWPTLLDASPAGVDGGDATAVHCCVCCAIVATADVFPAAS